MFNFWRRISNSWLYLAGFLYASGLMGFGFYLQYRTFANYFSMKFTIRWKSNIFFLHGCVNDSFFLFTIFTINPNAFF